MHPTPIVNIVSFPHPVSQVADQISFLATFLAEHAIQYQISNSLSTDKFNILIEGFGSFSATHIQNFCQQHHIKIAIILTEHMEIVDSLHLNEVSVYKKNEYIPPALSRFHWLCELLPITCFFITLGHLPLKAKLSHIFTSLPIIEVPFPIINTPFHFHETYQYDFVFQGAQTTYRNKLLGTIKKLPASLFVKFSDESKLRQTFLQQAKYALNIPQYASWRYISPMRCLYALQNGTPILNLSSHITHPAFDTIFPSIDPNKINKQLKHYLSRSPRDCFDETLLKYNAFVAQQLPSKLPTMINFYFDLFHQAFA